MNVEGRIQALNNSVRELIAQLRRVADEHPETDILIRVLRVSTEAEWIVETPTSPAELRWEAVTASGYTALGSALRIIATELHDLEDSARGKPPAIVVVSDGEPTDNMAEGLLALNATPLGRYGVRIAIALGRDADRDTLRDFLAGGHGPTEPIEAHNPEQLTRALVWSTLVASELEDAAAVPRIEPTEIVEIWGPADVTDQ